jgi:hypothetical protein
MKAKSLQGRGLLLPQRARTFTAGPSTPRPPPHQAQQRRLARTPVRPPQNLRRKSKGDVPVGMTKFGRKLRTELHAAAVSTIIRKGCDGYSHFTHTAAAAERQGGGSGRDDKVMWLHGGSARTEQISKTTKERDTQYRTCIPSHEGAGSLRAILASRAPRQSSN